MSEFLRTSPEIGWQNKIIKQDSLYNKHKTFHLADCRKLKSLYESLRNKFRVGVQK